MTDIMALGEVLIDLTQTGNDAQGIPRFAAFPGGAPANVAVAAARLGARTAFLGMVGSDSFGQYLRRILEAESVDTAGLCQTEESPTTLAIVSVDHTGERSFAFYRQPGADTRLTPAEAIRALDTAAPRILHFGSLSLTTEPSRTAAMEAVRHAKAGGVLVSYDPNFRPALWAGEEEAIRRMKQPLDQVDILKVSEEEMAMLTGTEDLEEGSRQLAAAGIRLVLVTLGSRGVYYRLQLPAKDAARAAETENAAAAGNTDKDEKSAGWSETDPAIRGLVPGVSVKVSDTNGAGDTFLGALLSRICRQGDGQEDLLNLCRDQLEADLAFANRAAARTCARPGAIPAMPTLAEMEEM